MNATGTRHILKCLIPNIEIIYPLLTPLKERLEAGERTPDLYNAIVEATR